ncbi:PucR family transcriptional regulator, partial [Sinomonas humi]|uniref:PucR family transcriptional regulator n=1 Tax=Sinomonas humi TaxID=1338436 RepID=UPI0005B94FF3
MGSNAPEVESPTLRVSSFLQQLPGDVRVLHDAGDQPLRWVEPSDLADPTPYLVDHELLLTSGLPLRSSGADPFDADGFVRRLVAAQVSALGFGLEPYFSEVPESLVEACSRHGLTLWEIPPSLPFAAIGLSFSRLLESENARRLRDVADMSRQLLRSVLGERPEQDLLEALSRRIGARLELYGARGQLRFTAGARSKGPSNWREAEDAIAELVATTLASSAPRVEHRGLETGEVVAFPLRSGRPRNRLPETTLGALLLALTGTLSPTEHSIVTMAVGLLEVLARQRTAGDLSPSQLATVLLLGTEAVPGQISEQLLAESVGGPRRAPLRVVVGARIERESGTPEGSQPGLEAMPEVLQWRRLWDTKLVVHEGQHLCALTRVHPSEESFAAAQKAGYVVAVSSAAAAMSSAAGEPSAQPGSFSQLREQALAVLPRALDERRSMSADDVPPSFLGLLAPEAGRLLAKELLAPLTEAGGPRTELLLRVLRAWLGANGSWDASASALGLHRNSVRRHIGAIADLLGKDLQDAGVRAELWLALHFV